MFAYNNNKIIALITFVTIYSHTAAPAQLTKITPNNMFVTNCTALIAQKIHSKSPMDESRVDSELQALFRSALEKFKDKFIEDSTNGISSFKENAQDSNFDEIKESYFQVDAIYTTITQKTSSQEDRAQSYSILTSLVEKHIIDELDTWRNSINKLTGERHENITRLMPKYNFKQYLINQAQISINSTAKLLSTIIERRRALEGPNTRSLLSKYYEDKLLSNDPRMKPFQEQVSTVLKNILQGESIEYAPHVKKLMIRSGAYEFGLDLSYNKSFEQDLIDILSDFSSYKAISKEIEQKLEIWLQQLPEEYLAAPRKYMQESIRIKHLTPLAQGDNNIQAFTQSKLPEKLDPQAINIIIATALREHREYIENWKAKA